MRRLAFLAMLLALAVAPAASASDPFLPPLPHSRLMDRGLQLIEHGPPVRTPPPFRSGFWVEKGKYRVGVSTYGGGLFFEVWQGGKKQRSMTAYLARGVARPERLQATFGRFGKVSMRFRPSRRAPSRRCVFGRELIKQHGLYVGRLEFRGEGGYVSVDLRRAKGGILRLGNRCHVRHHHHDFDPPEFDFLFERPDAAMLTISREGVDSTAILAIAVKNRGVFLARREESRGKLAIIRLALAFGPGKLRFDEALTSGRLVPPRPFHGTGRYRAFPDGSHTWTGDLNVNFPGTRRFPLTGPGFETLLEVPF